MRLPTFTIRLPDPSSLLRTAGTLTALSLAASAQTPFQDGELLVHHSFGSGNQTIYRIDPSTGNGAPLVSGHYYTGQAGWMTFDAYRGGLLLSVGFAQLGGFFLPHLTFVDHAGNVSSLGFTGENLRALHAVGDGRVYFQRHSLAGPHEIEVLDAQNQVHVLTDSMTGLPVDLDINYAYFVAGSNVLIAAGSQGSCSPPAGVYVFRIPLSPDGYQVTGPITCAGWDFTAQYECVNGIDRMPDGSLLMVVSHNYVGDESLVRIDPSGPTLTLWAETTQSDWSGLAWSTRLGRAVAVDDYFATLRLFDQGHQSGPGIWGDELATNVPVGLGSGYAWWTSLVDVNLFGSGCSGLAASYGQGLAGTGGIVPYLGAGSCPTIGGPLSLSVQNGRGGALTLLVGGFAPASIPVAGGTLLVAPPYTKLWFTLGGASGVAGAGSFTFNGTFPNDPSLAGVSFYLQAAVFDAGAVKGIAMTNGVELIAQ
jgi:hypothetical protein